MSKKYLVLITFAVIFLTFSTIRQEQRLAFSSATAPTRLIDGGNLNLHPSPGSFVEDQLVVKMGGMIFKNDFQAWVLQHRYPASIQSILSVRGTNYHLVRTTRGADIMHLRESLLREPLVLDVSLNYIASINAKKPNDPFFEFQYTLENTGQDFIPPLSILGTPGSDISATDGWDWSTGAENVIIAIVDTGIAWNHEDLEGKILNGYNFVSDNFDPFDDHGHGTYVASVAAAKTDNAVGMAGVSWHSKLLPVKVMGADGLGDYLAIAAGIRYAADNGAKVINLSIGGPVDSFILSDACSYAYQKGCVLLAASGNDGGPVGYPAAYDETVIAVGASDYDDIVPLWSNRGPQLDLVAPGEWILGALYDPADITTLDQYGWDGGTSAATPIVSGAAALLIAYKTSLTNTQVMDLLRYTCDDINEDLYPGMDSVAGYGRINLKTLLAPFDLD